MHRGKDWSESAMTGGDGSETKAFAGSEQKRDMNTHIRWSGAKGKG